MIKPMDFRNGVLFVFLPLLMAVVPADAGAQFKRQKRGQGQEVSGKDGLPPGRHAGPAEADHYFFEAMRARKDEDEGAAEVNLLQFIRIKPKEPAAYFELARISFSAGNISKADGYIRKAIALDEENKWYRELYASVLAAGEHYEKAAVVFEKLAADERHNEEYLLGASRLYQRAGKNEKALQMLDRLIDAVGKDQALLMQKQQLYLRMNDLESAVKVVRQLVDANPGDPRYYTVLAEIYENNGKAEEAAAVYRTMEERFADDAGTQLSLALFYRKNKDEQKYESYLKKAITNPALEAETQIGLLLPFLRELSSDTLRNGEGIELAAQLAAQHPGNATVTGFYGDILMLNDRMEDARVQYKKALDTDPSKFNVWQQLLFSYTGVENADSLVLYAEKALVYFPSQAIVHYLSGIGHYGRKNYTGAIHALERAEDLQSDDDAAMLADIHALKGDIYYMMKSYAESDKSYEEALRLAPANATVLNNYSYYLSERGIRLQEAESMSRKSLDIRPDEPTFLDTYGWILYKQGKYKQAETYIRKAVEANRDEADGTLWDHLGDIMYRLGRPEEALKYWIKARERGSENGLLEKKIRDRKLHE